MVTWQLTIDANDPSRLARFWAPVLGYELQPPPDGFATWVDRYRSLGVPEEDLADLEDDYCDRIQDPAGDGPTIWFQIVPEEKACTPGQLALAWVLAQGDDVAPIPGTKRVQYLEENVGAADVVLTEADLAALVDAVPRDAVVGERHGDMSSIDA
jgi:hypothetical protein